MADVTIVVRGGKVTDVRPYCLDLNAKDQVKWILDADDDRCTVEILFALGYGYHGPFAGSGGGWNPQNPARGWYLLGGDKKEIVSNPVARPDLVGSQWKYDVVVHHRESGVAVHTYDPYVYIKT